MKRQIPLIAAVVVLVAATIPLAHVGAAPSPNRVTILYDSFGNNPKLKLDWGYAALVEYGGKRILFDTGNNASIFEGNVKALGVDLRKIDFVVISHRHADHTSGLNYLFSINPKVKVYVPDEPWGLFARGVSNDFYRKDPDLPAEMRYYNGKPPEILEAGTPWPNGNFVPISKTTEVVPGAFIIPGVSTTPGTLELHELSLALKGPKGIVLVVGCSHPGVDNIVKAAEQIDPHVTIMFGGFHHVKADDAEVERLATALRDDLKVERVAPGHCTGEPEFKALKKSFGDRYVYAGLGSVVDLP